MSSAPTKILAGVAVAVLFAPAIASAQVTKNQGYLTDSQGNIVKSATTGVCVRTSDWSPARAVAECDPELVKKPAPPRKPVVKPKPKPKPKAKPKPKKKKLPMLNIEQKIELQGMPLNKAVMTEDNKKELDKFIAGLRKATKARGPVQIGAVVVTGHTDRLGNDRINKPLSEKRAQVVRDYLVSKGIDQKLIFWEGKAARQPIPVTKFCDKRMKRKQLIECLAPNRRVTVEVVGRAVNLKPKPAAKKKAGVKKPAKKPAAKKKR